MRLPLAGQAAVFVVNVKAMGNKQGSRDLHGSAPDDCPVALVLVDVINEFGFEGGERLARNGLAAARNIASLSRRARRAGVPCIYVNDNFARWRSDFGAVVEHCGRPSSVGAPIVQLLRPEADDYFVLKPKHSGFYQTCLSILLSHLGTETVIITGFSAESCVSFTAHDAYLRDYRLVIPRDGTASCSAPIKRAALAHLVASLRPTTPLCSELSFAKKRGRTQLLARGKQLP